jgi:RIP metalloprotease RseP
MTDSTYGAPGATNAAGEAPPRPDMSRIGKVASGAADAEHDKDPDTPGFNWSSLAVTMAVVAFTAYDKPLLLVMVVPFAGMAVCTLFGREQLAKRVGAAALVISIVFVAVLYPWLLAIIGALVAMIFLHELGHYVMAKRAGMKVTEFFLGFGPRIWSVQRGETEYGIKAIPAGAYVKIIGMSNLDEVPPEDEGRTYRQKSFGQRFGVAVAGSTMHFLLALGLIFVALVAVGQPAGTLDPNAQAREWRIDTITPGSGAAAAGLRSGDRITAIGGQRIGNFSDLRPATKSRVGQTVPVTYVRSGRTTTTDLTVTPFYSWFLDRVLPGSALAKAGLRPGDQVTSIAGTSTRSIRDLGPLLRKVEGTTVPITYQDRAERRHEVKVEATSVLLVGNEGYVGVSSKAPPTERLSVLRGVVRTPAEFANYGKLSMVALGNFFTPHGVSDFAGQVTNARTDRAASKTITGTTGTTSQAILLKRGSAAGPDQNRLMSIVGVAQFGSSIGRVDPGALLVLFALVNLSIGVINLTPLLPFDGGHVLIACYEKVQELRLRRRRYFTDVSRLLPLTYVVVILLVLLGLSTVYLDIANPLTAG